MGEHKQTHTIWPFTLTFTLTYDVVLETQATKDQGRPYAKRFKQDSAHRQTDAHTHGRDQTYYLTFYVVNKYLLVSLF